MDSGYYHTAFSELSHDYHGLEIHVLIKRFVSLLTSEATIIPPSQSWGNTLSDTLTPFTTLPLSTKLTLIAPAVIEATTQAESSQRVSVQNQDAQHTDPHCDHHIILLWSLHAPERMPPSSWLSLADTPPATSTLGIQIEDRNCVPTRPAGRMDTVTLTSQPTHADVRMS